MGPFRTESDTIGPIDVAEDRLWGAQTQRALQNFVIGAQLMPREIIHALARVKKVAAKVNAESGRLDRALAEAIMAAADEIVSGRLDDHFPLKVWQTGSGTQSHMNVNEVIANRANESFGSPRGGMAPVHPNDHVNLGQSSNDSFPTAMHVAAAVALTQNLLPALRQLEASLHAKARQFAGLVKIGRTHMQDATPITLGQEFSGYDAQLALAVERIEAVLPGLYFLAQGGTAVGTGLNARAGFAEYFTREMARETGLPFKRAENFFEALASHDALVFAHGALEAAATGLLQNRQRHQAGWQRSARRSGRVGAAAKRARLLDHARQGQSNPGRSPDHGLRAGVRQSGDHRLRRVAGPVRTQCDEAGHRAGLSRKRASAGGFRAQLCA